ncbi:MAG: AAA family ATPase [Paludibacteraceae bacterium]|nr:AAA family ATPase [Paludibacteraceae bacterium]
MKHLPFFTDTASPTHAKIAIYGAAGTGKTYTACQIAIGLCKEKQLKKPIAIFDTENGSDFLQPLFAKEGITCHVKKSRTFPDLITACHIAAEKASVLIIDSITHVWRELTQSYLDQYNRDRLLSLTRKYGAVWTRNNFRPALQLEPQQWAHLKSVWAEFTDLYLGSPLHIIVCGREAEQYQYTENESGRLELIQAGTRISGEKELSHEPSLLIQMTCRAVGDTEKIIAHVEKDRSGQLNQKEFVQPRYQNFKPYIRQLGTRRMRNMPNLYQNSSRSLFEGRTLNPDDEFAIERRLRTQLSEEIKGLLDLKIPGQTAQARQERLELLHATLHTLSWTKVENTPSATLQQALDELWEKLANVPIC